MIFPIALFGALLGLFGVLAGAFGAHALDGILTERGTQSAWETAVLFHLLHAVAVCALGWSCGPVSWKSLPGFTSIAWIGGVVLFSGSLYVLSTGGPRFLGPVTPLGGLFLLTGWLLAILYGLRQKKVTSS
jgi:uncharacterized membrane protein YgdD (TMEM256/DUF423 family)